MSVFVDHVACLAQHLRLFFGGVLFFSHTLGNAVKKLKTIQYRFFLGGGVHFLHVFFFFWASPSLVDPEFNLVITSRSRIPSSTHLAIWNDDLSPRLGP